jgi:hypothetical protein
VLRPGSATDLRIRAVAAPQHGVVTRSQLRTCGVSWETIEGQLAAGRWQQVGPLVIALSNGRLARDQVLWVAALQVGAKGCLAAATALEVHGFTGLGIPETSVVHVVHPRASSVPPLDGLWVHESRRLRPEDIERRRSLPVTSAARSAIDRASWQPHPRLAYAMVAAAVQQRLTRPDLLAIELRRAGRIRHAHHLRLALADVTGGAQALGELDLTALCRRHGVQPPVRQRIRTDRHGRRRYLDAEWELPQGRTVVLEVDGSHHMAAEHWTADMRRDRRLVLDSPGSVVLRCTSSEVRLAGGDLVDDLVTAGVPRRERKPVTVRSPPMAT